MNSIITSAVLGVIMMFSGLFLKRILPLLSWQYYVLYCCLEWILDISGYHFFPIDTHNMLYFEVFGLLFNCIVFASTLALFPPEFPRYRVDR